MKFLRFLCNFLLFVALCFGISCMQVGLYDISAAQSKDVDAIHISAGNENEIGYLDSYIFWVDDIKTNYVQDAKYRVRNWASWDWWKKGMGWADYAVDAVCATVKPIVVPIAQVNAIMEYYDYDINHYEESILKYYDGDYDKANDALYLVYEVYGMGYGETCYTFAPEGEEPILISNYNYKGELPAEGADMDCEYARWVRNNKVIYNHIWKLKKYNCGEYDKYFSKFISQSESGDRHIKSAVIVLYYQQYVAIVLALIFVIKFPISFIQVRTTGKKNKKKGESLSDI